jgi:hypothetical protein
MVGTALKYEGHSRSTTSKTVRGSNLSAMTTLAPASSGVRTLTTIPLTWNSGRISRDRSAGPRSSASRPMVAMASRLAWSSITPLGTPVVPLV